MIINVEAYLEVCSELMNVGGPDNPLYHKYSTRELVLEDLATLLDPEYPRLLVDTWKGEPCYAGIVHYDRVRITLVVRGAMRAGTNAYMQHLTESQWISDAKEIASYRQLPVSEEQQVIWDAERRKRRSREVGVAVEGGIVLSEV